MSYTVAATNTVGYWWSEVVGITCHRWKRLTCHQGCWIWFSPIWPMWHPKPGGNPTLKKGKRVLIKGWVGAFKGYIYIYIVGRLTPKKLSSWQNVFFNLTCENVDSNHGDEIILIPIVDEYENLFTNWRQKLGYPNFSMASTVLCDRHSSDDIVSQGFKDSRC